MMRPHASLRANIAWNLGCIIWLLSVGFADAQDLIPDSGSFRTHPLVAAVGDSVRLEFRADYPFSNASLALSAFSVEPELVTIDLNAVWHEGSNSPADATTTQQSVEIPLGPLDEGVYDVLVRVDGAQFFFSYFEVEAARAAPASLPSPLSTVVPQRPLGINLTPMKDHAKTLIFVDVFKPSRQWIPHRPSDETWDTGEALDLDEHGWVRSLQPDQEAGTLMMIELGSAYPGGRYTVLYDGSGDLHFEWDARIIDSQPGRMDLWVVPEEGIHVVIRETDPDNYIRNIRVIMPGHEQSYETDPFHPTYVAFLQQFNLLRFMDWSDSNEPENTGLDAGLWANRITPIHASQGTIRGAAYEYMIDLANTVGSDPWINVPITATDRFVDSLAHLVSERLDPGRTVWIELSNEIWNREFPQHAVAVDSGLARGYGDATAAAAFRFLSPNPEGLLAALRFQSARSVEIFDRFESVLGSDDRFRRVLSGWGVDDIALAQVIAEELLDWQGANTSVDAYAIAPYFGFFIAQQDFVDRATSESAETLLDTIVQDMRYMLEVGRAVAEVTSTRGVDLVTYEAGHHMVRATEVPYPSDAVRAKADLIHADERMYDIYSEYLVGWFEYGAHMNLFNDFLALGNFGLAARWDQSQIYPKHRAVLDFLQTTGDSTFVAPGADPPVEAQPIEALPGDGDDDGDVDLDDFFAFVAAFGRAGEIFDFTGDGFVRIDDFFLFVSYFGTRR